MRFRHKATKSAEVFSPDSSHSMHRRSMPVPGFRQVYIQLGQPIAADKRTAPAKAPSVPDRGGAHPKSKIRVKGAIATGTPFVVYWLT